MNKLLLFFASILLFNSCSNENDIIDSSLNKDKKYTLNFKVKDNYFDVESNHLRSLEDNDIVLIQMIIYSNTGKNILEQVYYKNDLENNPSLMNKDGSINFSVQLAEGNYYFAFLGNKATDNHPIGYKQKILGTDNYAAQYYTDMDIYHINNQIIEKTFSYDNSSIYYETGEFNIESSEQSQNIEVSLKPMWSYIDVNIKDAQTFEAPQGTNAIQFDVNPLYYGFGVKSKLATFKDENPTIVSLETIRANPTFNLRKIVTKTDAVNNTIGANIIYLKIDGDTTILESRKLEVPQTSLENGYYYNINGNLGGKNSGQSMNISLGEFNKEDVVIEF